nr:response regulator [Desulfobacterales bacterium]
MKKERTVLFAEPVEAISSELHSFLTKRGYRVMLAGTLKETLLTLQSQSIDVLVLDAALLEKDCGFISVIKGMVRDLPIIICAEVNTPELESRIRQQRIFYYHVKSFGIEDLEMAISNAINKLAHKLGGL